ncbi:ParA family protein [Natronomonas sp. F2-12]|jgi:septum site-determining protein MinD|uniref:ParA family protein n=1 Tax=Natronomonas aquatica TaxID=2841590 RepID=A0A9R1CSB1_9EURY|nr:ParA family protein [Natronomonas aquatica]MCQ4334294.1 ParA family protein [Natronomonas aquatica]
MAETVALVGAAGGVGTTRTTLACAERLAHGGHDTAVLDAAYGTQGLADRIDGEIAPDMTELCIEDEPLESGLLDPAIEGGGRLAVCPARAPFSRLSRAKSPDAAENFEARIAEAERRFEYVLIDTPPIAANQAVAAATGAGRVAVVCDASRVESALPRTADRLEDVGVGTFTAVVTRQAEHPDADVCIPALDAEPPILDDGAHGAFTEVIEATTGTTLEEEERDGKGFLEALPFK